MSDFEQNLRALEKPAVHLVHTNHPSKSHLGGEPNLPAGVDWPQREGRKLPFLARISLRDVQSTLPIDWLPKDGALLFFFSDDEDAWGFEPEDGSAWRVLHVPDLAEPIASDPASPPRVSPAPQPRPSFFARLFGKAAGAPASQLMAGGFRSQYPCRPVAFRVVQTLPTDMPRDPEDEVPDDLADEYAEAMESSYGRGPKHSISGHPYDFQGSEMEPRCQDIYDRLHGKKVANGESHGSAWRLLLQLDSDEDAAQMMWGDAGLLFFWVRAEEAAAGNFENVWMMMECC